MVKKTTTIKTNSKDSEVSSNTASESSSSAVKTRIIHTSSEQSEKKKNEEMRKAVKEGVAEGLQSRAGIESTEDKLFKTNSQQHLQVQETVKANEKPNEAQQAYAKMINGLKSLEDGLGNRNLRGGVTSSLVLGADAISPAFGKAVQVAITSGLGKTLFNGFNSVVNKVLGLKKDKTFEEKTAEALEKQYELAEQQIESTEDTNKKLESINDTLIAQAKGAKLSESVTVAKEKQAEAREREKAEGLQRLFKGTQKASKKTSAAMGTLKKWFTGLSMAVLADYLFNEQFRETVNVYIKDIFKKGSTAAKIGLAAAIGIISAPLISLGVTIGTILGPIGLLGAAVVGLGALLYANRDKIKKAFAAVIGTVKSFATNIYETLSGVFKGVKDWIVGFFKDPIKATSKLIEGAMNTVFGAVHTIFNAGKKIGEFFFEVPLKVYDFLFNTGEKIGKAIAGVVIGIKEIWPSFKKSTSQFIAGLPKTFSKLIDSIWSGLKNSTEAIISGIKGAANAVWSGIKGLIKFPIKIFVGAALGFKNAIIGMIAKLPFGETLLKKIGLDEALTTESREIEHRKFNDTIDNWFESKEEKITEKKSSDLRSDDSTTTSGLEKHHEKNNIVIGSNVQTTHHLKTDNNNGRKADMEKQIKIVVLKEESKQENADMPSLVNTLPSNPAMRPSLA